MSIFGSQTAMEINFDGFYALNFWLPKHFRSIKFWCLRLRLSNEACDETLKWNSVVWQLWTWTNNSIRYRRVDRHHISELLSAIFEIRVHFVPQEFVKCSQAASLASLIKTFPSRCLIKNSQTNFSMFSSILIFKLITRLCWWKHIQKRQ